MICTLSLHDALPIWLSVGSAMPEVIINGPEGRIEGRYHHARGTNAPMALVLHPHPLHGGTMNNKIDRKSTRLNSSHMSISYAVFCLKKKTKRAPRV